MNLDKTGPAPRPELRAPEDWTMEVIRDGSPYYTAVIALAGATMCRLSIAKSVGDDASARTVLADKGRRWIRDFLSRHPATSS
ncbi:hypothetical protein [Variovorax sp. Sphag1AA]|uniref:hypothetical protein n=1 Tax=Variovorax sp. Sphag1AA TaxID=2587027 RepID=UPI00161F0057|nr:hypothetical protein [Variovorax sp. Sphag1AA]MBB3182467.1 hypothetical protein [Variovorax sp. Sphag1AA]